MSQPVVTLSDVTFEWPDGTRALSSLNGAITGGRTGLVGRNGAGKSTLLKLVAGLLTPSAGRVEATGEVGYLPQTLTWDGSTTVAGLLGIADVVDAINAVERGDTDPTHFDTIGDDWDIEARVDELLDAVGFSAHDLGRRVDELSGGEAMLIAITGLRVRRTPITLLDEPTNNLDRPTRARVHEFVRTWPGSLVVVSHDLELLDLMETTTELHAGRLTSFGGGYTAWREHLAQSQAAAETAARTAQQALKVEKRQRVEAETKLARRERAGRATQWGGGIPKILAGRRANNAQHSAGAMRTTMDAKVDAAQAAVDAADARVRSEDAINIVLPDPGLPRGRRLVDVDATVAGHARRLVLQGPERIALVGPNGVGKSTFLDHLLSGSEPVPGRPTGRLLTERVAFSSQRLEGLHDDEDAMSAVRRVADGVPDGTLRNQLARLLVRGAAADRPLGTLSGGERFRVALAQLLLAQPTPELVVLDEPTNNLDTVSVEQLTQALAAYRGALLVVSHDHQFLAGLGLDRVWVLGEDGISEQADLPD